MKAPQTGTIRLLLLGAGPRLVGAAAIIAALWLGFFWATGNWGSS